MDPYQRTIEHLLEGTGIGTREDSPCRIQVHDPRFYRRVLRHNTLGLGESYMEGWWDCDNIEDFFYRLLRAGMEREMKPGLRDLAVAFTTLWNNPQSRTRARREVSSHYDRGNDLYHAMLDRRMIYSCAFWDHADNLDQAQEHKLDLTCRKLKLEPGQKLLDIGCGWGGLARYAAERYGVSVVGITLSPQQVELAREACKGMDISIQLQDYRDVQGSFDRVVSIGMFEHVGGRNYDSFMDSVHRVLKPDGLFLLHTIGSEKEVKHADPWLQKYIFPGSRLPSAVQITRAIEMKFRLEDWQNFGPNYNLTLRAWLQNFEKNWPSLREKYGDGFFRQWKYYLSCAAATFSSRKNNVWQIVMAHRNHLPYYQSIR
ncbi:MAG TPA: cyclopropane fatty acyl phospholipid synthase [Chitinophagaceae bacterium]|nr:cyclopropane fatty acyl phospholipid synthase [Chitinophagaceae bacterium]